MREVEIVDVVGVDIWRPALQPRQAIDDGQSRPRVVAVYVVLASSRAPFRALVETDAEGVMPLTRSNAAKAVWSWGESNPRPSAGGRTRYDHSRR